MYPPNQQTIIQPKPPPGDWAELELDTRADGKGIRTDKDGKRLKANIWLSYLRSYQVCWAGHHNHSLPAGPRQSVQSVHTQRFRPPAHT